MSPTSSPPSPWSGPAFQVLSRYIVLQRDLRSFDRCSRGGARCSHSISFLHFTCCNFCRTMSLLLLRTWPPTHRTFPSRPRPDKRHTYAYRWMNSRNTFGRRIALISSVSHCCLKAVSVCVVHRRCCRRRFRWLLNSPRALARRCGGDGCCRRRTRLESLWIARKPNKANGPGYIRQRNSNFNQFKWGLFQ